MPLDLNRPRDLGALFNTVFALYGRYFLLFGTIALAVVLPVLVVVDGLGLGQLTAGYDSSPPMAGTYIELAAQQLVITPLVTAMHVHAVLALGEGRTPTVRESIRKGLDSFAAVLAAVLLADLAIAGGFLLLILPGVYLAVRFYFVPQSVVVDGRRGTEALRRSGELVRGAWWRVFGIVLLFNLTIGVPVGALEFAVRAAAKAANSGLVQLVGTIPLQAASASFTALTGTMLFFDMRARKAGARTEWGQSVGTVPHGLEHPERPPGAPDPPAGQ